MERVFPTPLKMIKHFHEKEIEREGVGAAKQYHPSTKWQVEDFLFILYRVVVEWPPW